ncbi:alpha/beta hydrolase family protein [Flammeovirga aprica]|uniref:Alpha/beta hydrolase n=1 Tax=Flammeovirga aprica JL-4 TaxID=694437 RepID=A0A7X9P1U9_9BACT|nr:prolyl oligopeptidase family serine peptidase [Flammeovirga aprica]NME67124.1 alpha/beta hydrolase [Flammeovirga aprica JL-4]
MTSNLFFKKYSFYLLLLLLSFSCSTSDDDEEIKQVNQTLVSHTQKSSFSEQEIQILAQLGGLGDVVPLVQNGFSSYNVEYNTKDKDGKSIVASGVVAFPTNKTQIDWVILSRGTILSDNEAPSVTTLPSYEIGAALGFAIIVPDLIGFGSTSDYPQYYFIKDKTGEQTHDLLKAAQELAGELSVSTTQRAFITGYSQGGYSSMAVTDYLQKNNSSLEVLGVLSGAGGYDLLRVMEEVLTQDEYDSPSFLALIAQTYYTYYGWDINTYPVFNENIENIETLLDGRFSTSDLNNQLPKKINELFHADFINSMKNKDTNHPMYKYLMENSVNDVSSNAPFYLYHSPNDEIIPIVTSEETYDLLRQNNNTATFRTIDGASHSEAAVSMLIAAFDDINEILK